MRPILRWLVQLLYGFRAYNEAVLNSPGPVLLLPNHSSWWDWLLIGVCLEEDWRFVTSIEAAERNWLIKRVMINRRTFPVDMNSPYAVKHMAEYLHKGGRLVLFPEGRLSRTGSLMKLFDGTGFLIVKTHAKVITAYIRGAKRLPWSPNPELKQWFPRLSAHFSAVLTPPKLPPHTTVTEERKRLTDWLYAQMVRQQFETEMEMGSATLPEAIVATARKRAKRVATQDASMQELTYRRLLVGARALAERWRKLPAPSSKRIGVLLPNVNAMPVTMMSLWAANRIPAILNYSLGGAVVLECAKLAGLKQIISSRVFVQRLELDVQPFANAGIELLFLEDIRASITRSQKLRALLQTLWRRPLCQVEPRTDEVAIILFTSGSEGAPKGVELTHGNLLANIRQMLSVMDLVEKDRFFNALPLFHSFGLTIGLLLPLVEGVFVFLYVSPLHYRVVPSALYNLDCTVFFGTNTFLTGYARKAHPYDFRSLRYLFAGAEKLQPGTIEVWMEKFGVRVFEGYGVTECSPAIAANTPIRHRAQSTGQLLPGIEHRLEPVEGISDGANPGDASGHVEVGRLFVRGPNVMRGYINPEANAAFEALGGWYDTGDIAKVDADGFLYILGRLKRFAKISGEMISLTAIEDALAYAFPQYGLKFAAAVVAKPDEGRGEKLIAVTNEPRLTVDQIREAVLRRGLGNLATPRAVKVIQDLPRLGSGKINHRELERMV